MFCGAIWLLNCSEVADIRVHFESPIALRANTAVNLVPILSGPDELFFIADLVLDLDL